MQLPDFKLERFFAKYEFKAPYLMCGSDCESFSIQEILDLEPGSQDRFTQLRLGYTEAPGSPELREEIAALYINISPAEILVHVGAEEAIFNFMQVALKPGDHVIVQFPCYQSLYEVARAAGCEVSKWELKYGPDGWAPDLDNLKKAVNKNTKAIVINSPHNPTGYLFSRPELDEIIAIARKNNILLFSDEVYKYLEYDPKDTLPWASDLYENAVSLGVMSKTFGLPGLRIGWIATRNRAIYNAMAAFKDYTTICNSAPAEFLAATALRSKKEIIRRNLEIIDKNLNLLDDFFVKYSRLFAWHRPKAGPIAFPGLITGQNTEDFCIDLVNKKGVLLLPGNYYDFGEKHFRVGYGRRNFKTCLTNLEEYVVENLSAG